MKTGGCPSLQLFAVESVKENPDAKGGMAPVYGMAARLPLRGVVGDLLERYMDLLYKA